MHNRHKGTVLVVLQFLLIALIIYAGRMNIWSSWQLIAILTGFAIAAWAIISMRKSKLRVSPVPDPHATLVTSGIYKWIRHPMYLSVILITAGFTGNQSGVYRQLIFILLVAVLIFKSIFEERLLQKQFPQYQEYCKSTYRLVPYIF